MTGTGCRCESLGCRQDTGEFGFGCLLELRVTFVGSQQLHAEELFEPCSARCAWYAFQPGHQPVCQRHSRDIKALGLVSAFFRIAQVSQPKVFSCEGVWLFFKLFSSAHTGADK